MRYLIIITSLLLSGSVLAAEASSVPAPDPEREAGPEAEQPVDLAGARLERDLASVELLGRAGANELALTRLEELQAGWSSDPDAWFTLEKERAFLLRKLGRHLQLAERLADPSAELPEAIRGWMLRARVDALVAAGRGSEARELISEALWPPLDQPPPTPALIDPLRTALIRSMLDAGLYAEARVAIQRYLQDVPDAPVELRMSQARLFLETQRAEAAIAILERLPEGAGDRVLELARLRAGRSPAPQVFEAAISTASRAETDEDATRSYMLASEAAQRMGNRTAAISALERALSAQGSDPAPEGLLRPDPDALWAAYLDLAEDLGNQLQLIIGDDAGWFTAAAEILEERPVAARALLARMALAAYEPAARAAGHLNLMAAIGEQRFGDALLDQLYLVSQRPGAPENLPEPLRARLADHALARGEVVLASELMHGLSRIPQGVDPADWLLRRARVLVLGGRPEEAVPVLQRLVTSPGSVEVDRLMQVMFDLQAIERHEDALSLFGGLDRWQLPEQTQREVLFWQADSLRALGRDLEAARAYLESAGLVDPVAMDPWAQTARYQAAAALADAGLVEDARSIYSGLLRATRDPARQALLRHELQQLFLEVPEG